MRLSVENIYIVIIEKNNNNKSGEKRLKITNETAAGLEARRGVNERNGLCSAHDEVLM